MTTKDSHHDDILTELIVTVFRLNGSLIETGNNIVEELGLTTAWWQVLGALSRSPTSIPVAHIARNMGLSRQSVQRSVDLLADRSMVRFAPNPHHQRAKLVILTPQGIAAFAAADDRQLPLGRQITTSIGKTRIAAALNVLNEVDALLSREKSDNEEPIQEKGAT